MGLMKEIYAVLKTYVSIVTFVVIAIADYVWEDKYFTCPCVDEELRVVYSTSFVLSPALFLLLVDFNCKILCIKWKKSKKCTGFSRPFILAGAWLIYSLMDPRFSECVKSGRLSKDKQKHCTDKDQPEGLLKSYLAMAILAVSFVALTIRVGCGLYRSYCVYGCTHWWREITSSCTDETSQPRQNQETAQTAGQNQETKQTIWMQTNEDTLSGQTLIILEEEDLLDDDILKKLGDSDFKKLENRITMGQMVIIKNHCERMNSPAQGSGQVNAEGTAPTSDQHASSSSSHASNSPASQKDEDSPETEKMNSPAQGSGQVNAPAGDQSASSSADHASNSPASQKDEDFPESEGELDAGSRLLEDKGMEMTSFPARSAFENSH